MKVFKKLFPYVLTAGMIGTSACGSSPKIEHKTVVRVIGNKKGMYYCDNDGDSLVDCRVYINRLYENPYQLLRANVKVGDTLVFSSCIDDLTAAEVDIDGYDVKSVNGRSLQEIDKINKLNQIRVAAGQEKVK